MTVLTAASTVSVARLQPRAAANISSGSVAHSLPSSPLRGSTARPRNSFVPPRRPIKEAGSPSPRVSLPEERAAGWGSQLGRRSAGGQPWLVRLPDSSVSYVCQCRRCGRPIKAARSGRWCTGPAGSSPTNKAPGSHSSPHASVRRSARPQAPVDSCIILRDP